MAGCVNRTNQGGSRLWAPCCHPGRLSLRLQWVGSASSREQAAVIQAPTRASAVVRLLCLRDQPAGRRLVPHLNDRDGADTVSSTIAVDGPLTLRSRSSVCCRLAAPTVLIGSAVSGVSVPRTDRQPTTPHPSPSDFCKATKFFSNCASPSSALARASTSRRWASSKSI